MRLDNQDFPDSFPGKQVTLPMTTNQDHHTQQDNHGIQNWSEKAAPLEFPANQKKSDSARKIEDVLVLALAP